MRRFLTASALAVLAVIPAHAQQKDVKVFTNSVVQLPPVDSPSRAFVSKKFINPNQKLELHFQLSQKNQSELDMRVANGEVLSPSELRSYNTDPQNAKKLKGWLNSQGYEVISTSADNSSVYAYGSVSTIQKSLHVQMQSVVVSGVANVSTTTPPELPRDVGAPVVAIDGLQPWVRASKHVVRKDPQIGKPIPSPAFTKEPPFKVGDIISAYSNLNTKYTGKGITIAILIDTTPKRSDLDMFLKLNHQPPSGKRFQVKKMARVLPDRSIEETMDAEWALGIAPQATVRLYAAGSLQYPDLDRTLDQIIADAQKDDSKTRLKVLSISLGLCELYVSEDEIKAESSKLLQLAALGVATFVSSGDAGSNPDSSGHAHSKTPCVEYEASDPHVIAVGGTSLSRLQQGKFTESGWRESGGGVSSSEQNKRPVWQKPFAAISSDLRMVPDVSSAADPSPGAFIVYEGRVDPQGGTSWGAPTWAGFAAKMFEAAGLGKKQFQLAPFLYALPRSDFNEILSGSNGAFYACAGWNPVTGLGTPKVDAIIAEIENK